MSSKYINITRQHIEDLVATENDYQITETITKRTNKPIISKYPNELWSIDLIDLQEYENTYKKWRYIMTVVDVFSRRYWLRKLIKKEATHTRDALEGIISQEEVSPKFLLSDNGTEFLGEFQEYCKENDIKQLFTRSYSPRANADMGRINKQESKIINSFWIRQENTV